MRMRSREILCSKTRLKVTMKSRTILKTDRPNSAKTLDKEVTFKINIERF